MEIPKPEKNIIHLWYAKNRRHWLFPAKDIDDQKILQSDWTRHILNCELNCSKITFVYFEIYHSLSEILITRILQWQWGLFKESSFFGPILGQKRIFREFKFWHFFVSKFLSLGKIKIKIKKKKGGKILPLWFSNSLGWSAVISTGPPISD